MLRVKRYNVQALFVKILKKIQLIQNHFTITNNSQSITKIMTQENINKCLISFVAEAFYETKFDKINSQ